MKRNKIIGFIISIVVLGLTSFIIYDKLSFDPNDKNENNPTQELESDLKKENDFTFNLDISNKKQDNEISYKLNNEYTVKLVFTSDDDSYNIYVNDTYVLNDFTTEENIKFYVLGDSLIYVNSGYTDIRCEAVYVINNKTVTKIYELDNIKGMVPERIEINKDNIIIKGSRFSHGPSIVYGKAESMDAMIDDSTTWAKYEITKNTIVEATYTYNVNNNKLNLNPTITNQTTLKDYLENN